VGPETTFYAGSTAAGAAEQEHGTVVTKDGTRLKNSHGIQTTEADICSAISSRVTA
jgi:hypothetical protein